MDTVQEYIDANRQRFVDDLIEIVRIPSISSSPDHRGEVARCAEHLAGEMLRVGLERAEVVPTAGHPMVYGERVTDPARPTVLIYGHYDVQPVDPLDQWQSPPFEPQERGGELYGRGTVDDKGQVYVHLKAIESWLSQTGDLPVNVKLMVEGEEEIGSENLTRFLLDNHDRLAADAVLISDTPMFRRGYPSICYGLRGLCYMEVHVRTSPVDLHSGSLGGVVANPANALAEIIAKLHDDQGRVTIPGFYDRVRPIAPAEREALAKLPFDEAEFLRTVGAPGLVGEAGFSTLERLWARPTLDVNGIWGGFSGEGTKTIIPATAAAKISMRLVADQDPEEIARLFEEYVPTLAPPGVTVTVRRHHGGRPFIAPVEHPAFQAADRALERAFGRAPVYIREGGSIPFVAEIADVLQRPCLLVGFGLPDENSHAPNELSPPSRR
ncbi:MAG TPA: dipeptidase [Dehalococcoidia bacterium]|nr:dipeptidase [Dehalococcoidia bacterium]